MLHDFSFTRISIVVQGMNDYIDSLIRFHDPLIPHLLHGNRATRMTPTLTPHQTIDTIPCAFLLGSQQ